MVGAGAIGNETIKNLALLGVGRLRLFDFDHIEARNLSRCVLFRETDQGRRKVDVAAERVRELAPDVAAMGEAVDVVYDLGVGAVRRCNVVLGCIDNRLARRTLNELCFLAGVPWIDAAIDEMNGQVRLFRHGEGACYECLLKATDLASIQARYSCGFLAREKVLEGKVPTTVTSAALVGAWQAQEAAKVICGQPVKWGAALISVGMSSEAYTTELPRKDDCPLHARETYEVVRGNRQAPWSSVLEAASADHVSLRHSLITALACAVCDKTTSVLGTLGRMTESEAECPDCNGLRQPGIVSAVARDSSELIALTPAECGIPESEILLARNDSHEFELLLETDP